MCRMSNEYIRLVHLFVKPDLRDEIKIIKKEKTYDEFLRNLIKKNDSSVTSKSHEPNKSKVTKTEELS